jgi:hypothetical protein
VDLLDNNLNSVFVRLLVCIYGTKICKYKEIEVCDRCSKIHKIKLATRVRWVLCHHGMACPQVADGRKASRYEGQLRIY